MSYHLSSLGFNAALVETLTATPMAVPMKPKATAPTAPIVIPWEQAVTSVPGPLGKLTTMMNVFPSTTAALAVSRIQAILLGDLSSINPAIEALKRLQQGMADNGEGNWKPDSGTQGLAPLAAPLISALQGLLAGLQAGTIGAPAVVSSTPWTPPLPPGGSPSTTPDGITVTSGQPYDPSTGQTAGGWANVQVEPASAMPSWLLPAGVAAVVGLLLLRKRG